MTKNTIALSISLSLVFGFSAGASTVQLTGDNTQPGFVNLVVDGTTYQALDFTPQRYAATGDVWTANAYDLDTAATAGYYSPSDPYITFPAVQADLEEDIFLFNSLKGQNNAATIGYIQAAVYKIAGGSGVIDGVDLSNSNVSAEIVMAQNTVTNLDVGDTSDYRFVESPFTIGNSTVEASDLHQGFIIEDGPGSSAPEPSTLALAGSALLVLSAALRRRGHTAKSTSLVRLTA
jgi:hypothetical protein